MLGELPFEIGEAGLVAPRATVLLDAGLAQPVGGLPAEVRVARRERLGQFDGTGPVRRA